MNHIQKYIFLIFIIFFISNLVYTQNSNLQNQVRLARSFEAGGKLLEAERIYSILHTQQPGNITFYNYLFNILIKQKKYPPALELTNNQLISNKDNFSLLANLGSVNFLTGNENEAISIWEEALSLDPKNPFAYRSIANKLIENRLIDKAIETLIRGNSVSDDPTMFSYDVANLYSLIMKYDAATEEYCKILLQKPKQLHLVQKRIFTYINSNRAAEPTIATLEEIYENNENIFILKLLSEIYLKTNNYEKALIASQNVEKQITKNGKSLFTFAQKCNNLGAYEIAAKAYNIIIEDYPKSALFSEAEIGYIRSLESSLAKTSQSNSWKFLTIDSISNPTDYENLVKAYKNLVKKYNNKISWEAEFRIAQIYLSKLNNYYKADSIFAKITTEITSLKFISKANYGLSQIAIKEGNLILAQKYLNNIISSRISNIEEKKQAQFFLAKVLMWQSDFTNSIELLNEIGNNPDNKNANDAIQYSLILSTFKSDSLNLSKFTNSEFLLEQGKYDSALVNFENLAKNKDLYLLNHFSSLRYAELLIALNYYDKATNFLEEINNCDEDNIFGDRFLYLLGSNYYYGKNDNKKALVTLTKFFNIYPNSIYYNKVRNVISEIKAGASKTI